MSRLNSAGVRVQDTCQELVWACDPHEHGEHSYTALELALGSVPEGSICANPTCAYTDSESSGSSSGSSALPPLFGDSSRLALASRAWRALHWNHRVSLGIGAVPASSETPGAPTLSYEHQRTCVGGHTYWSCDASQVVSHGSRVCPTAGCGQTYSDCLNMSASCLAGGYHASAPLSETVLELDSTLCPGGCGNRSADVDHQHVERAKNEHECLEFLFTHEATHLMVTTEKQPENTLLRSGSLSGVFQRVYPVSDAFDTSPVKVYELRYPEGLEKRPDLLLRRHIPVPQPGGHPHVH